ncbi:MAG TPA: aspartate/glutamate racemase family protein, partial [Thermoanaerobaculia bacterium]|nr:aspartate/glutamate racemase family protein [Thermoanaerobaculia bacterium]
ALAGMGAGPIVIACVTVHHMLPGVPEPLRRKVVSLVELVIDEILRAPGPYLLLCTTGTRRARIFDGHPRWGEVAESVIFLDEADQHELHRQLYVLKDFGPPEECLRWLETLPAKYGRDRFIFACTELHLLHRALAGRPAQEKAGEEPFGILDPLWIVARDARRLLS